MWRAGGGPRGASLLGVRHHPGPQPAQPPQEWEQVRQQYIHYCSSSSQCFLLQALVDQTNPGRFPVAGQTASHLCLRQEVLPATSDTPAREHRQQ